MGTQITNTLSGQTTGNIITVDYSSDFTNLQQSLADLSSKLETLNTTIVEQSSALNQLIANNLTATSAATPGTIPAALKAMHTIMANTDTGLAGLNRTLGELGQAVASTDGAFSGITGQLAVMNATSQIMVAETASKNAFDQAATQAALERNGLPAVEVPQQTVEQQIAKAVETASSVGVQSQITGFVSAQLANGFQYVADIISEYITSPITSYLASKWTAIKGAFAANNSAEVAADEARNTSSTTASTTAGGTPYVGP